MDRFAENLSNQRDKLSSDWNEVEVEKVTEFTRLNAGLQNIFGCP
jgi:hypothetical protein